MSNSINIVDRLKASTGADPILADSKMGYSFSPVIADLTDDEFITKKMGQLLGGGGALVDLPVIPAGSTIPFFVDVSLYSPVTKDADVITKATSYDLVTGIATGRLQVWTDMLVEDQDTNNDGTGTFTGWNIYGHDDGTGKFKEDTYVILTQGGDITGATNVSELVNDVPYATVDQVKVGRNAANFGQTASLADVGHYGNTGGDNTFACGAWLNFLSGTGNVIVELTWTDGHGHTFTETFYKSGDASGTTYGAGIAGAAKSYSFDVKCIRAADGTTITISTTVSGTVLYEVGGFIDKKVGDGGL